MGIQCREIDAVTLRGSKIGDGVPGGVNVMNKSTFRVRCAHFHFNFIANVLFRKIFYRPRRLLIEITL